MKSSILFSILVIFGHVNFSSSMSMAEPISFALLKQLHLSQIPTKENCKNSYEKIMKLKTEAGQFSFKLKSFIFEELPDPKSTDRLEELIDEICIVDEKVKRISRNVVFEVQNCLKENGKVNDIKGEDVERAIVESICQGVSALVMWDIQVLKMTQY